MRSGTARPLSEGSVARGREFSGSNFLAFWGMPRACAKVLVRFLGSAPLPVLYVCVCMSVCVCLCAYFYAYVLMHVCMHEYVMCTHTLYTHYVRVCRSVQRVCACVHVCVDTEFCATISIHYMQRHCML